MRMNEHHRRLGKACPDCGDMICEHTRQERYRKRHMEWYRAYYKVYMREWRARKRAERA